jgi:hypothetical protein
MFEYMRQQIFTANGLSWKDYDEATAEEILEDLLTNNQIDYEHSGTRVLHPTIPILHKYLYIVDHGHTTNNTVEDKETLAKTVDLKKDVQLKAIGLVEGGPSDVKKENGQGGKKLKDVATRVKTLQIQAVRVSTDLIVKSKTCPDFVVHHDAFEVINAAFNEFPVSVSVGIAQLEEAAGDTHTATIFGN